jgi:hypothetical protein
VLLSWQAHYLPSHPRCGFSGGPLSGAAPGRELGCQAQDFVAAPSSTLRIPAACSRLRKGHVLSRFHTFRRDL